MEAVNKEILDLFNNELVQRVFIVNQIKKNYKLVRSYFEYKKYPHRKLSNCINVLFATNICVNNNNFEYDITMPLSYRRYIIMSDLI